MAARQTEFGALPRSSLDVVIDSYKKDVDRTLLREALELTPTQRLQKLIELLRAAEAMREAGARAFR